MIQAWGLNFGTSNSTMGRVDADGVPHLLALEESKSTIPSVLFFGFEDDSLHFGRQAVAEYIIGADGRLMRSLKSALCCFGVNLAARHAADYQRSQRSDPDFDVYRRFPVSIVGIIGLSAELYSEASRLFLFAVTLGVVVLVVMALIRWIG
ncbi:MAG: hypothetical protein MO846_11160 [Candidatus Devosia symbiotica]|nr:hypothetical protein [Candidatus Devosia symbiotica]